MPWNKSIRTRVISAPNTGHIIMYKYSAMLACFEKEQAWETLSENYKHIKTESFPLFYPKTLSKHVSLKMKYRMHCD